MPFHTLDQSPGVAEAKCEQSKDRTQRCAHELYLLHKATTFAECAEAKIVPSGEKAIRLTWNWIKCLYRSAHQILYSLGHQPAQTAGIESAIKASQMQHVGEKWFRRHFQKPTFRRWDCRTLRSTYSFSTNFV